VLDDGVRLGDDAHLPAVVADEARDDARPDVRLAGSGRTLHREVGVVEVAERANDGADVLVIGERREGARAGARRDPAEEVDRGILRPCRMALDEQLRPLGDRIPLPAGGGRIAGDERGRQLVPGLAGHGAFGDAHALGGRLDHRGPRGRA
jgi:hypothetical protein